MTDSNKTISPLRQRMIDDMVLRGFSTDTQRGYIGAVAGFAAFLGRSPDQAGVEDLRRYQVCAFRKVPDSISGRSEFGFRVRRLGVYPSAFAGRGHAETEADETNDGEGCTCDPAADL